MCVIIGISGQISEAIAMQANIHFLILQTMEKLGYHVSDTEIGLNLGVCVGITQTWMQTYFEFNEESFFDAIRQISNAKNQIAEVTAVKNKVKNKIPLSVADKKWLAVLAIFDMIELYHSPNEHSDLLGESLTQMNVNEIAQVMSDKSGICHLYSEPLITTKSELTIYFNQLHLQIESLALSDQENIAISFNNNDHWIGLRYDLKKGKWFLLDPNNLSSKKWISKKNIAEHVMKAFNELSVAALNTTLYTKENNQSLEKIRKEFIDFKSTHIITSADLEKKTESGVTLLHIAAKCGHVDVAKKIIGVLSQSYSGSQLTQLLNQPDGMNRTPRDNAIAYGNAQVLDQLLCAAPDIFPQNKDQKILVRNAASLGRTDIIDVLLQHDPSILFMRDSLYKLNLLLFYAVQHGHVHTIERLLDLMVAQDPALARAQLLTEQGWVNCTLLHVAAERGHIHVIQLLLKYIPNLQLDQQNEVWGTPLHHAAQYGQADTAAFLINQYKTSHQDNSMSYLNIKNRDGKTALEVAIFKCKAPCVELLTENLFNSKGLIGCIQSLSQCKEITSVGVKNVISPALLSLLIEENNWKTVALILLALGSTVSLDQSVLSDINRHRKDIVNALTPMFSLDKSADEQEAALRVLDDVFSQKNLLGKILHTPRHFDPRFLFGKQTNSINALKLLQNNILQSQIKGPE